jgi:hypothetical protein
VEVSVAAIVAVHAQQYVRTLSAKLGSTATNKNGNPKATTFFSLI